jgi:hypothetical protein
MSVMIINVICRSRIVGRIWRHDFTGSLRRDGTPFMHWDGCAIPGRADATAHAPTLEAVMADFAGPDRHRVVPRVGWWTVTPPAGVSPV